MSAAERARGLGGIDRLAGPALARPDGAGSASISRESGRGNGLILHAREQSPIRAAAATALPQNERSCYFAAMNELAKGDRTRARILDEAVELASVQGLGGLTIGPLAERLGLSKSGLFAHFHSKEALQVETLDRAAELFRADVTEPLRAVADRRSGCARSSSAGSRGSTSSRLSGGCPILAAAIEFDDVPGPVHDAAARHFARVAAIDRQVRARRAAGRRCRSARRGGDRACDVASGARAPARPTARRAPSRCGRSTLDRLGAAKSRRAWHLSGLRDNTIWADRRQHAADDHHRLQDAARSCQARGRGPVGR